MFSKKPLTVEYLCDPKGYPPVRKYDNDAGFDLSLPKDYKFNPHDRDPIIDFGVHFKIPSGAFGLLTARSSLTMRGCTVALGVIDADYIGPITAKFFNIPEDAQAGYRVCQIVFMQLPTVKLQRVKCMEPNGRGFAGLGSTGRA